MKKQLPLVFLSAWLTILTPAVAASFGDTGSGASGMADFAAHCARCHSTRLGKNGIGPSLAGIYGSTSGTVAGYTFSPAMKSAHLVWDDQSLNKFLQDPADSVHGTKMRASVPDDATRQRIVSYLQTLKSSSTPKN